MNIKCIGKHLIIIVEYNNITYECLTSSDLKNLYECTPSPEDWVEMEILIRDAALNGDIEDLDIHG